MRIELPEAPYKEIPKQSRHRALLLDSIQSLPGVDAVMVSELPLSGDLTFVIEGQNPDPSGNEQEVQTRSVGGNYFQTMKILILSGRGPEKAGIDPLNKIIDRNPDDNVKSAS
ncbi:hypothetical protein L0152_02310 [bacterium]|nr:hypothetical protein [bacterium]